MAEAQRPEGRPIWNEDHWDRLLTRVESASPKSDQDDTEEVEREYVDATDALSRLGISQMHVSRLQRHALSKLRLSLRIGTETAADGSMTNERNVVSSSRSP